MDSAKNALLIAWLKSNGFLVGLFGMLLLAWMIPDWGARGGAFRSEWSRQIAVFVIFFVQGLSLPTESLRQGLIAWRLHGFVLTWNYLGFPLMVGVGVMLLRGFVGSEVVLGFVYLAILPTTITSAVFFTGSAKGDVAGAVFSTAVSNLLSVFLVPLGVIVFLFNDVNESLSFVSMFAKLCRLIVLPMLIGQLLRVFVRAHLSDWKPCFRRVTTGAIFFIMYCTFADGVKQAAWGHVGWSGLLQIGVGSMGVLVVGAILVWATSGWLPVAAPTRVAAFYCASQKSLATGVPMAASIFPAGGHLVGVPDVSVIVLPLMCYHFLQLTLAARLVERLERVAQGEAASRA